MSKLVRIGCGAGYWGDSPEGPAQLVREGAIDYLVMDYLAEITMSILARMKAKRPDLGYATDFVSTVMKPLAKEIAAKKIRVVTNAGGVNPEACRDALLAAFKEIGVELKVALVHGDDLAARADDYRAAGTTEMFSGVEMPGRLASVNAYLGAFPIAAALNDGADVVITGRVVDSAIVLGPLIHEFGWLPTDYDLLSAGSLAGHIIECGTQATGGIVTDWKLSVNDWDNMGYPIVECGADGSFDVTKTPGLGGVVIPATVAEQVVYEVGDPARYVLPDVIADWSVIRLEQVEPNRVRVTGAKGQAPTDSYKVSATYLDGYGATATMMIVGRSARERAEATARAILKRSERLMGEAGLPGFSDTLIEVLGAESNYGANARPNTREVLLKLAVRHHSKEALSIFCREVYPAASAMAQSITGFVGGRPEPQPIMRLFSFLAPKADIRVSYEFGGATRDVIPHLPNAAPSAEPPLPAGAVASADGELATVPLLAVAHGRSGDKGNIANIGVLARRPEYLPWIRRSATPGAVGAYFAHFVTGEVERFEWPGLTGLNFMLHEGLGGGGVASLRHDPQGKAMAQILMDFPIEVPAAWLEADGALASWKEGGRP